VTTDQQDGPPAGTAGRGVLYIAFGERYVREAIYSASTLRAHSDVPVTLFADRDVASPDIDRVEVFEPTHKRAKVEMLPRSPYDRTLYLDSDTRILDDVSPLFDLLDRVDIAAARDYVRRSHRWAAAIPEYAAIPEVFGEFNCGVLLYRRSEATAALLEGWNATFQRYRHLTRGQDQASFRMAMWSSDIRYGVLPSEWNRRSAFRQWKTASRARRAGVPLPWRPRILHWHGLDRPGILDRINPSRRPAKW
jgi:hypothetical protein